MANSTPDFEDDLLRRAITLVADAAVLSTPTNALSGEERPSKDTSVIPLDFVFVQSTSAVDDFHNDGPHRIFGVQFLIRSATYSAGWTKARAIYDKIHLSGRFTGTSGAIYYDVRASTPYQAPNGPNDRARYFAVDVDLFLDGWLVT